MTPNEREAVEIIELIAPQGDYMVQEIARAFIARMREREARPDGVPEFLYGAIVDGTIMKWRIDPAYPDGGFPKSLHARYKFDGIIQPANPEGK